MVGIHVRVDAAKFMNVSGAGFAKRLYLEKGSGSSRAK